MGVAVLASRALRLLDYFGKRYEASAGGALGREGRGGAGLGVFGALGGRAVMRWRCCYSSEDRGAGLETS